MVFKPKDTKASQNTLKCALNLSNCFSTFQLNHLMQNQVGLKRQTFVQSVNIDQH